MVAFLLEGAAAKTPTNEHAHTSDMCDNAPKEREARSRMQHVARA